jgi:sugar lactone lactonase YvrE
MTSIDVFLPNLHFPEGLRWHDGRLWFSDIFGGHVYRMGSEGPEIVAEVPGLPSGLGFLPDGSPLVVALHDRTVLQIESDGSTRLHADLSDRFEHPANDMVVDRFGRAYVGNYGFDADNGADPKPTRLIRVDPDGDIVEEEPPLLFPNGALFVDEGRTMIIAETFADRITRLRVDDDGSLHDPVSVAVPAGYGPDGIDVDEAGGVWVACAFAGEACIRVAPDGSVTDRIEFPGEAVLCPVLGGDDGRTLHIAISSHDEELAARERVGRIVTTTVDVPAMSA